MKKQSAASQSRALKPVTESLPAIESNISNEVWERLNREFKDEVQQERKNHVVGLARGGTAFCAAMALPMALTGGVAVAILIPVGLMVALGSHEQKQAANIIPEKLEAAILSAQSEFKDAQIAAYSEQKKMIVETAEMHLSRGKLLTLEDAAWLGNLCPDDIEKATNQLAITVLQIRKMLAYQRCTELQQDGTKIISRPELFADNKLAPDLEEHRKFLRRELLRQDVAISEDGLPVLQEAEPEQPKTKKVGAWKAFSQFVNPLSGRTLRRDFREAQMPRFKPVEVPGMQPVADFAAALESYELQNPPLDLPAVRGWKSGQRKALPSPRSF